jgi:hypothetical protein
MAMVEKVGNLSRILFYSYRTSGLKILDIPEILLKKSSL